MRTYFHVFRKEHEDSIQESTDADECTSGRGIQVARTIEDASKYGLMCHEQNKREK